MNNNILTKMVIACLCCCTMLVAKTHIDNQVDPSVQAKIDLEQQTEANASNQEPAKVEVGPKAIDGVFVPSASILILLVPPDA